MYITYYNSTVPGFRTTINIFFIKITIQTTFAHYAQKIITVRSNDTDKLLELIN